MTHYEYAAGMIDDAISQARCLITLWDDDGAQTCDGWYVQIREFLEDALEAISPPNNESSEPWSAIEWAFAHMPLPEKLEGPTFSDGGYSRPLDERAERQPTIQGRVRWLAETQQDRLMAAAARLRALAAMGPETAVAGEQAQKVVVQASISNATAGSLYAKNRTGLTGAEEGAAYGRKRVALMLKSPEHREGKYYRRQSVLDLAAADEAAAASEDDRKLEKLRGKNKKTVTYKF